MRYRVRLVMEREIRELQARNRDLHRAIMASNDDGFKKGVRTMLVANDRIIYSHRTKLRNREV